MKLVLAGEVETFRQQTIARKSLSVAVVVVFLGAVASAVVLAIVGEAGLKAPAVFFTIGAALLALAAAFLRSGPSLRSLLHPMVAPLAYLVYSLMVPLAYMALTDRGIQVMPRTIYTAPATAVMCLTVLGYCLGAYIALNLWKRRDRSAPAGIAAPAPRQHGRGVVLRAAGRLFLVLALAAKVQQLITLGPVFTRVYGANQLDYDLGTTIAVAGATFTTVGCLLVMYVNVQRTGRPLLWLDWALLGAVGLISLFLLGTRSEVIAPVVLYLWFRIRSDKKFSIWIPVAALGAAAAIFALVAQLRVKSPTAPQYPAIENLLVDTSSPILLTSNVAALVPDPVSFYLGSTYLEAVKFMLPGPIARALFGDPTGTGAFAYRDLIDFDFTGQGWGFSLPTEAYLNFGYVGVVVVAVLLGLLFGRSYTWAGEAAAVNRLSVFVYPLLISYLPFGLRSDALGQMKSILYPLLIVFGVLLLERLVLSRSRTVDDDQPWRWRDVRLARGRGD